MRADIHDGPEHNALQAEAGYIDARPHQPSRQSLLHRTAGPYIGVKSRLGAMSAAMSGFQESRHRRLSQRCNSRRSRTGCYGILDRDCSRHSAFIPANLTTLVHFSVSSAMNFPKSAGEPANTAAPRSVRRVFVLGSARAALISLLSFSTISVGVAFGTTIPYQPLASKPGRNSPTVGTSGRGS